MSNQKSKILLEKINSLYKSMRLENGQISPIEKDLMLSYLRQLYDLFLNMDEPAAGQGVSSKAEEASSSNTPSSKATAEPPKPEPLKRTYTPPRIIEIPDAVKAPPTRETPPSTKGTSRPEPQPEPVAPRPKPEPPQPAPKKESPTATPELEALFEQKKATELSEKLSESPINDLTRALAINDRLLFMNELFGKDMLALDESLKSLNKYSNMEEAKGLLLSLASRYDWTEEEKIQTAKTFIKLVRRRYNP